MRLLRPSDIAFACVHHTFQSEATSRLREQLAPLLSRTGPVVLDLRAARLDSSGLGALLSMQCRLKYQNRRMFVVSSDPAFHHLLAVTGVSQSLEVFESVETAMRRAQAP